MFPEDIEAPEFRAPKDSKFMEEQKEQGSSGSERTLRSLWKRLRANWVIATVMNVLAAVIVIALVQTFFVKLYVVPSGSMEQTLQVGDRILVNRTAYAGEVPKRGDVVVFSANDEWREGSVTSSSNPIKELVRYFGDVTSIGYSHEKFLVKRVIGVPGDTVSCCSVDGKLLVNGQAQTETYIYGDLPFLPPGLDCTTSPISSRCFPEVKVPEGQILVMGDHRGNSKDSVIACRGQAIAQECIKFVPVDHVIGHTFAKVWPLTRIGSVK